jgi:hypothetical protein
MVCAATLTSMSAHVLHALSLRWAVPTDDAILRRLAQLDSTRSLRRPVALAERDGVVVAALSVADGRVAADPFEPTAEAVALLRLWAPQPRKRAGGASHGLRRLAFG